ncbi:c-type cytochrome [Chelativorans sp. Marseille-P2723]|uniref:c-type cytochrome n=1 Tax=Chelativorans sp. Marseille-P2723 TaxID=2709133 RepID=UPI00156F040C|nr:c-type cytochrome [Chelativorans sp. Marseille-P2723]
MFLALVIVLFAGLALGAVFIFSGVYNVAAARHHFDITNAVIRLTLRRSVKTHSLGIEPPAGLAEEALARLGARHYALGCEPCHASPASSRNPVVAEMYPAPPPLSEAVNHWQTEELFWIVKNGLKFTGMPSWPAPGHDEEVWALVAFLERLPNMDLKTYAELTGSTRTADFAFLQDMSVEGLAAMCGACHGDAQTAPVHPFAPPLHGQKPAYLRRALIEYAQNRRQSGIMEPIANELGTDVIEQLARFYSNASGAPMPSQTPPGSAALRRGEEIAEHGIRGSDIPACRSCHADSASGEFPRLDGLPAEYIAIQLRLFRDGVRASSTYAAIMAPIAQRLSEEQIEGVAAFFASQRPIAGEAAQR